MSEQLALQQMLTQGGAGNLDEGPIFARAEAMDIRGKHAFAGAAFAGEQHRRIAIGNLRREFREFAALRPQRQ